jgi:hypothetical protein
MTWDDLLLLDYAMTAAVDEAERVSLAKNPLAQSFFVEGVWGRIYDACYDRAVKLAGE